MAATLSLDTAKALFKVKQGMSKPKKSKKTNKKSKKKPKKKAKY